MHEGPAHSTAVAVAQHVDVPVGPPLRCRRRADGSLEIHGGFRENPLRLAIAATMVGGGIFKLHDTNWIWPLLVLAAIVAFSLHHTVRTHWSPLVVLSANGWTVRTAFRRRFFRPAAAALVRMQHNQSGPTVVECKPSFVALMETPEEADALVRALAEYARRYR